MAYDASNNKTDQQQVAGSTPLGQGGSTPAANPTPDSNSAPSTPTPMVGSSSTGATSKGPSQPKSNRASSGMFTNIQKYVEKNKPQTAKMAESSLSNIRQVGEDIKAKQSETVNQFTQQAQASGLQNTEQQVQKVQDYTQAQVTDPTQTQMQENEFANIINAQYTGPQNLTETDSLYRGLLGEAREAERVSGLAKTDQGRQSLLREQYAQDNKDYSRGASKLDNLLLGQEEGYVQGMTEQAGQIGTARDIVGETSQAARSIANQTQQDVQNTKEQARAKFQEVSGGVQNEVNNRINQVIENWDKLPAHFRAVMSNPDGSVNLSKVEAETLGVQSGEGLYNLTGEDLFGTTEDPAVAAERARLISTGEQANLARLQALSNLAQGGDKLFDIGEYYDENKAGTQTAFDALNLPGVREKLAQAEQDFRRDAAKDVTGVGRGKEKYNKGGFQGRGTIKKTAERSGNLKDILAEQGYNFDSDIQTEDSSNVDLLQALARVKQNSEGEVFDESKDPDFMEQLAGSDGENNEMWNSIGDSLGIDNMAQYMGTGGLINLTDKLTGQVGDKTTEIIDNFEEDVFGSDQSLIGDIFLDPARFGGEALSKISGGLQNLNSNIFGGGKSAARKKAQAKAEKGALRDLKNKLSKQLDDSGFSNRLGIQDNEETTARTQALMNLLGGIDRTNT